MDRKIYKETVIANALIKTITRIPYYWEQEQHEHELDQERRMKEMSEAAKGIDATAISKSIGRLAVDND